MTVSSRARFSFKTTQSTQWEHHVPLAPFSLDGEHIAHQFLSAIITTPSKLITQNPAERNSL